MECVCCVIIYARFVYFYLDEFKIGVWEDFSEIRDHSLIQLASSLPRVVLHAKARSTTLKYAYGWNRWKIWSKSKIGVAYLPAPPMFVALYLRDLLDSAKTTSPLDTAVYSIRWGHTLAGFPSPTDHPLVQSTYQGCSRILSKPREPKDPVQPHMLQKLIEKHGHNNASPADLRLFIVLVGYSGFLRIGEILSMQVKHIQLIPEGMSIFLPKRKNDQFRAGNTIYIAKTNRPTCPVSITERLLQILPSDPDSCYPVVRRLTNNNGVQSFHQSRGISYTTAKDIIKSNLGVFFEDLRKLGTHSLRSGGASDPGCRDLSDLSMQRHGGWECVQSKNKYIHPSSSRNFEVSKNLSI